MGYSLLSDINGNTISTKDMKLTPSAEKQLEVKNNKTIGHKVAKVGTYYNGHDSKLIDELNEVLEGVSDGTIVEELFVNYFDDQEIEGIIEFFKEKFKENEVEGNVILPKGTILEWDKDNQPFYSAKAGAKGILSEDYTDKCEFVKVKFLDELADGQINGGYYRDMFK